MLVLPTTIIHPSDNIYDDLFTEIDRKLAQYGKTLYNNITKGYNNSINRRAYKDLLVYREMLEWKRHCDDCLCDVTLKDIISRINRLINLIC